ncbi:MAG TPA: hypothetical protein PKN50_14375 [Spirochaetota bacterium]|nr:hypothetical protein [Spirochaetota bacterium]HPV43445.1 hypothetical protein [Spirochaetota bacterium]
MNGESGTSITMNDAYRSAVMPSSDLVLTSAPAQTSAVMMSRCPSVIF